MLQVEVTQAQESLPELIEAAAHGEEVIITQAAAPVAKLVAASTNGSTTTSPESNKPAREFADGLPPSPFVKNGRLVYGSMKGKIIMSEDFDAPIEGFEEYQP
jgi:prevent-host-death family protein